ncbi:MAG TPA: cystathionine gamma-synthase family protein [Vitreimonas sp.]|uniref:cystathionine gamma-synthase family protein n=1 Tax=Vitreimonas sp. TaxID=3069702 RepID=UPI002D323BFA|nr:cystathionine gamma-synthase family protein [Vitreimonas sp.]HYD87353.1 cystathionine gamma-synthase family protein [Vitreimonas sp.]
MAEKKWRKRTLGNRPLKPETLMMGYGYDPMLSEGSLKPPQFQTSTFVFKSAEDGKNFFATIQGRRKLGPDEEPGLIYSRFNNPNLEVVEDRLALWDEAETSLLFASGMAAISTALLAYLRPGDVILQSRPIYGGTETLIHSILPEFGVTPVAFEAELGAEEMRRAALRAKDKGRIGAIFIETPANPTNALVDIDAARDLSRSLTNDGKRPPVIVDNTLLGPVYSTPLQHGADIVLMSLTKYVGGHSDLIAGSASGSKAMLAPVRRMRSTLGTMADTHTAWLLMRSLETLKIRMEAGAAGARKVAEFLRDHPKVQSVWYLDFLPEDHADRPIHERQNKSPGSTFSFEVKGGEAEAFRVLDKLQIIKLAVSLGGTETLASHPAAMTHSGMPAGELARYAIRPNLIRISIGIEDPDDLIADLAQALDAI